MELEYSASCALLEHGRGEARSGNRPIVIDLCCGRGGWSKGFIAQGYHALGIDIVDQPDYPGEFLRLDVRHVSGRSLMESYPSAVVVVASPPCEEFTRHMMPWTKRRNPPEPSLEIVKACRDVARNAGLPLILENVREAQRWIGRAQAHYGSRYLWGAVPALMPLPYTGERKKESLSSTARAIRAEIPLFLAEHIARVFKP